MKIRIIGEDFPDGKDVDWPFVPGTGDLVSFRYPGGTTNQRVTRVEYEFEGEDTLTGVTVDLEY